MLYCCTYCFSKVFSFQMQSLPFSWAHQQTQVYCTVHQGDAAMEETVWDDQQDAQPLEAAADTAGGVGEHVECIAECAVSIEAEDAVVDAVAVDAAEVGAAAVVQHALF